MSDEHGHPWLTRLLKIVGAVCAALSAIAILINNASQGTVGEFLAGLAGAPASGVREDVVRPGGEVRTGLSFPGAAPSSMPPGPPDALTPRDAPSSGGSRSGLGGPSSAPAPTEPTTLLPFEQARARVWRLHLRSRVEWDAYAASNEKPAEIPSLPQDAYALRWVSWDDWLGVAR